MTTRRHAAAIPADADRRRALFEWGSRTFVMGIVNVTPDSFSGDGLLAASTGRSGRVAAAVAQARRMVEEGADILDVGGESTRPGHEAVSATEESGARHAGDRRDPRRPAGRAHQRGHVQGAGRGGRARCRAQCSSTTSGVSADDADGPPRRRSGRCPLVVMHNRAEAALRGLRCRSCWPTCAPRSTGRVAAGVPRREPDRRPGLRLRQDARAQPERHAPARRAASAGPSRPARTSRKSTLGRVLGGLPPEERLEGTLATTALGIAAGVDIVRVHDVLANVRAARDEPTPSSVEDRHDRSDSPHEHGLRGPPRRRRRRSAGEPSRSRSMSRSTSTSGLPAWPTTCR